MYIMYIHNYMWYIDIINSQICRNWQLMQLDHTFILSVLDICEQDRKRMFDTVVYLHTYWYSCTLPAHIVEYSDRVHGILKPSCTTCTAHCTRCLWSLHKLHNCLKDELCNATSFCCTGPLQGRSQTLPSDRAHSKTRKDECHACHAMLAML